MTDLAVAVVNYNTRDFLRACLASIVADKPAGIVVVDNGSKDGSAEMVAAEYPSVRLVVDPTNPGYGTSANRAIGLCDAPYVLLLNSDTLLPAGATRALAKYLDENPRAGIVGPRLRKLDGRLQETCHEFPTPVRSLLEHTWIGDVLRAIPFASGLRPFMWPHDRPRVVPWVTGAAMAIRKSAFDELGGFDPSFYMYYEETDLCYRMRLAGWETHFAPVTDLVHYGGVSTKQFRTAMYLELYTGAIRFYRRHRSPRAVAQVERVFSFAMWNKIAIRKILLMLTRDESSRVKLRQEIDDCRAVLRRPWRQTTT